MSQATAARYYYKDGKRVRYGDARTAHRSADYFELTYRERLALDHENIWPNTRDRVSAIVAREAGSATYVVAVALLVVVPVVVFVAHTLSTLFGKVVF